MQEGDSLRSSPRWPVWLILLLLILLLIEIILVCGSASLFNLIIPVARNLERPLTEEAAPKAVNSLDFSPDGQLLAAASADGALHLWQVADGGRRARWPVSARPLSAVAFSPDGAILAAGSWDGR